MIIFARPRLPTRKPNLQIDRLESLQRRSGFHQKSTLMMASFNLIVGTKEDGESVPMSAAAVFSPLKPTEEYNASDEKSKFFRFTIEIESLIQSYHQVKLFSVKVLQCCDNLKTINQDGRIGLLQEFVSHFRL